MKVDESCEKHVEKEDETNISVQQMSLESIDGHAWAQTCQELFHLTALRKVSARDVVSTGNGYPKVPSLLKTSVDSVIISNNYQIINNYASKWFLNYWKLITYLKRKLLPMATDSSDPAWFFGTATPQLPPWRNHLHVPPGAVGNSDNRKPTEFSCEHRHISAHSTSEKTRNQLVKGMSLTFQIEALTQPRQNLIEIQGNQHVLDFSNLIISDAEKRHKDRHFEVPTLQVPTRLLRLPACWPVLGTACAVPVVVTDQNGSEWIRTDGLALWGIPPNHPSWGSRQPRRVCGHMVGSWWRA